MPGATGSKRICAGRVAHFDRTRYPAAARRRFLAGTALVAGLKVEAANPVIIAALKANGELLHEESLRHSYPHCWRHKTPVIFRATPQWFISMERARLREHTLRDIRGIEWTPAWGEQRITSMIETRPDWCISRQIGRAHV